MKLPALTQILPVLIAVQSVGAVTIGGVVIVRTLSAPPSAPLPKRVAAEDAEGHPHSKGPAPKAAAPSVPTATVPTAPAVAANDEAKEPKEALASLFEGNVRFMSGQSRPHDFAAERKALLAGQHPQAIVLSCSDSRVPPELVFDQTLGELFVVRSAGNVADKVALASMEYAAEHLHVKVLLVLGHEKCGAVTAATQGGKLPSENLETLMAEIRPSLKGLEGKATGDELVHRGVEANVAATAEAILEHSPLLAKLVKEGELTVVEGVYELDSGQVRKLAGPQRAMAAAP